MQYKTIIDNNGYIVDKCVMFINNEPQFFKLENNMKAVDYYDGYFLKPYWNGSIWEESATEEEIKAWQEENKVVQEPSMQDILNSKIIADNATLLKAIEEQKKLNADLLLKIAMLGGKANV